MVDSISPDLREVQKPPKITRRQLLGILGGSLAALVAKKVGLFENQSQAQPALPALPESTATPAPLQPTPTPQPQIYEEPLPAQPFIEKKDSREVIQELLFPFSKYLAKEADLGMKMVDEQIEVYRKTYRDKAIGPKEIAQKVHGLQPTVEEMAKLAETDAKNIFKEDHVRQERFQEALLLAAKILPGLIFAESQGEQKRVSEAGAIGLCQLMPKTIREYAQLLNIASPSKEREFRERFFDEKLNIYLGLIHLSRMLTLFPDPGLAIWAYHLGEGEMGKAVIAQYTRSVVEKNTKEKEIAKQQREEIDEKLNDKNRLGTAVLVNEYGINFIRVMGIEAITNQFQGKKHDSTLSYVKNVGAGLSFLNQYPQT